MAEGRATYKREYYAINAERIQSARKASGHTLRMNLKACGLTVEQYDTMRESQDGKCACCATPTFRRTEGPKGQVDQVDHCHATGCIRGLLCSNCNTALGLLKEDATRINALMAYLENHCG